MNVLTQAMVPLKRHPKKKNMKKLNSFSTPFPKKKELNQTARIP